jgi:hypothetical protein
MAISKTYFLTEVAALCLVFLDSSITSGPTSQNSIASLTSSTASFS